MLSTKQRGGLSLDNWGITWLKNVQIPCAIREEEEFQYDAREHYLITIRKMNCNFVLMALFNSQLLQYVFSMEMQSCFMAKLV